MGIGVAEAGAYPCRAREVVLQPATNHTNDLFVRKPEDRKIRQYLDNPKLIRALVREEVNNGCKDGTFNPNKGYTESKKVGSNISTRRNAGGLEERDWTVAYRVTNVIPRSRPHPAELDIYVFHFGPKKI